MPVPETPSTSKQMSTIALPEIISALSFALDLTEGALPGHALRCCLLGMRLGAEMGLPTELMTPLYYALQLKDVGCSSNAARLTQLVGGDDRAMKAATKLADWTGGVRLDSRTLRSTWRTVLPGKSLGKRVHRMVKLGMERAKNNQEMIQLRCERGSSIVRKLELGEAAAEAVHQLDEHWDGTGYPRKRKGEEISLLARICTVAQQLDFFAMADDEDKAIAVIGSRGATCFDPRVVEAAKTLHTLGTLWAYCRPGCPVEVTRRAVVAIDPSGSAVLAETQIDTICEVFADVVDAKSPFTYRHSLGVADVAEAMAREMGLDPERVQLVRRAALLHDLGKLGVPNTILDKNGSLTPKERSVMREHPFLTRTILERVSSFEELARIAGEHHEKLDGTGYPLGIGAAELCLESRLIAVADCFAALAENRPYRKALDMEAIVAKLRPLAPAKLDAACFSALTAVVGRWDGRKPASLSAMPDVCEMNVRKLQRQPGRLGHFRLNR